MKFLEQHGLEAYVDGGWAVDGLLGQQTRARGHLDKLWHGLAVHCEWVALARKTDIVVGLP